VDGPELGLRRLAGEADRLEGGQETLLDDGHTAYCASKAGVHGMTRAMAVDLGADNIRCNAIAPGWITSDLSETYLEAQPDPAAAREALNRLHPLGRVGRPTDVGDLAVHLASDSSSFLTGEIIVLDGGRTAMLPLPAWKGA
jgi:meso-butanediol dehydrogenase/(S,S)-butanediol dehydrogenase/diacetyl reductase